MNLGNLINKKLIKSKYENKKALYEAMKEIIGDDCCAYNTFTEALSKNKSLSDRELLTLSVLLDLNLNKLALHYIKSQRNCLTDMSVDEYLKQNKKGLILYANCLLGNEFTDDESAKTILTNTHSAIYFLNFSKKHDRAVCYEFNIKKNSNGYLLKTNQIANFSYFQSILEESDADIDAFTKFSSSSMIEFVRDEGELYYELYPERKQKIEDVYLEEFKLNLLRELIVEHIETYKTEIVRALEDCFFDDWGDYIKSEIEEIIVNKNLYSEGILEMLNEACSIFVEEVINRVPEEARNEIPLFNPKEYDLEP